MNSKTTFKSRLAGNRRRISGSVLEACLFSKWLLLAITSIFIGVLLTSAASAQSDKPSLKYKWEPGQQFQYEFEVKYEIGGDSKRLTGKASYELYKKDVSKNLSNEDLEVFEEGEATSTAFAVTSDGYLLTCAHCVRGARKIEITVGEKTMEAKIIDVNYDQDLALIKIEAENLPFVTLGKTKTVELAQDVRAIGYPLSSVLGNSVKVTRGSIAGFIDDGSDNKMGHKTLQIDVAVNHGNSGGPLVDETGTVVGVVNAKLSGKAIAKVGFAVPIKLACEMLDRNKVKYDAKDLDKELEGPELAKKMTPAVLFVQAEIGPGGEGGFSNYQFSTSGNLSRPKEFGSRKERIQSDTIIATNGSLLDSATESRLPLLLGTVGQMPFEELPAHSTKAWSRTEMFALPLPKSASRVEQFNPFDPFGAMPGMGVPRLPRGFGGPFGPRGFGGFGGFGAPRESKPETRMALGQATTSFKVKKREGDLVTIAKKMVLETIDDKDQFSSLKMVYESELVFDTNIGMFVAQKLEGDIKIKLGEKSSTFPIEMTYKKVRFEDFSKPQKVDGVKLAVGDAEKSALPKVGLTNEQIDRFLKHESNDLESKELLSYLNRLSGWKEAESRKPEIVKTLVALAGSAKPSLQKTSLDALLNWEPGSATPFVIAGLEKANAFSKRSWILKLGKTGHPDAAKVLCGQLADSRSRRYAKMALIQIGADGEVSVLDALKLNADNETVANACLEVLGEIGTESSVEPIGKLVKHSDWKSKSQAESALKQISGRK